MAHDLEHAGSMVSVNTPWHKLGIRIGQDTPLHEVVRLIGADRKVSKERAQLADGTELDSWATVRHHHDGTRTVLGHSVGERYTVLQDVDAIMALSAFEEQGKYPCSAGMLGKGGRVVWVSIPLTSAEVVKGDQVDSYALMTHSHDGSITYTIGTTDIAVVCRNTLTSAMRSARLVRARHTSGISIAAKSLSDGLARHQASFGKQVEAWRALSKRSMNRRQVKEFLEAVIPSQPGKKEYTWQPAPGVSLIDQLAVDSTVKTSSQAADELERGRKLVEEVLAMFEEAPGQELEGRAGTAWGAYNALTYYTTHKRGRGGEEDRFLSSQAGTGAAMMARGADYLMSLVA